MLGYRRNVRIRMNRINRLGGLKLCFHGSTTWDGILDFSTNVYPVTMPNNVIAEIVKALDGIDKYPDSESRVLREKISEEYNLTPDCVIAGNGSTELIRLIAFCFGDGISFIPQPTFSEYEYSILLYGGNVVSSRIPEEKDFLLTEKVLGEMPEDTKLVFLCNPNNPTGRSIPENTMYSFLEEARNRDVLVVVDEVYQELSDSYSLIEKMAEFDNIIVLRSLTKAYGLCGLRLGYAVADEKTMGILDKVRPPWNVNAIAQRAGILCINHPYVRGIKGEVKKSKEILKRALRKFPLTVIPSETNFFLINVRETRYNSSELTELLLAKGVYVRDCSSFPHLDKDYIRVGVKTKEMNEILIEKLGEVLE